MSMPADAIATILGLSPSHLWVMGETAGSTFADQIAGGSGGKSLTAAAGCTPNGWTTSGGLAALCGYRNNGGPGTAGALMDGSTSGYASAATPTIGAGASGYWINGTPTTQTGVSLLLWMDSLWNNSYGQAYYAEGAAGDTERLAFWNNNGNLQLTYKDSGTGGLSNASPAGNIRTIQGGQSWTSNHGQVGGQLLGFTINPNGTVQFWQNAKHCSALSAALHSPSPWGAGNGTYLGAHPSTSAPPSPPAAATVAAPRSDLTSVAQMGANEIGSNLLQTSATSLTGWSKNLAIMIGSNVYTVTSSALVGVSAKTVQLTLTSTLKTDLTASAATISPILYGAFRGALGWCSIFPTALSAAQVDSVYQALTPEPASGPAWKRSRSGVFYPGSQLWNEPLPGPYAASPPAAAQGAASAPAPVDPQSANIITYWQVSVGTGKIVMTNYIPIVDLDHTGRQSNPDANPAHVRSEGLAGSDQNALLRRMPVADLNEGQEPQPGNLGGDAQASKNSPQLGLHYNEFKNFVLADSHTAARNPMWHAQILSPCTRLGSGSLPAGTYVYAASYVMGDGSESSCVSYSSTTNDGTTQSVVGLASGELHDVNVAFTLASTGSIRFVLQIDNPAGYYYAPVTVRLYRRGPGSTSVTDFEQLADIAVASFAATGTLFAFTFTDDGSLTPNPAVIPYGINQGFIDPVAQQVCAATFAAGVGTPASGTPIAYAAVIANNGSGTPSKQVNVINGAVPVTGARVYGPGFPAGTKVAASPAPTQTAFYTTANTTSPQAGTLIGIGAWTPAMSVFGQAGPARAVDAATLGGGGSWDWYANAAFLPSFRPTTNTNNGASGSSCPEGAGFITYEEAVNAAAGDIHAIKHPLSMTVGHGLQSGRGSASRYPAKRYDGADLDALHPYTTREGMKCRLPASFDPTDPAGYASALSTDPSAANFQMAIAQALRDYGVLDRDSSPGTGLGSLYVESPAQAGKHPYGIFMGGLNQGGLTPALLDPIPWLSLQVLKAYRYASKTQALATFTATTSAGVTLSAVSSFATCYEGLLVTASDGSIAPGTSILAVNAGAGTATLSQPASSSASVTITPARRTNRLDAGTLGSFGFQQMAPY